MKVTLFDYTGAGTIDPARHAASILLFTKSTRLKMSPDGLRKFESMANEEISKELKYMSNTLPSSWEFIHFSFLIEDVSRAFTHQLVRTRTAGYAQQAMRILEMDAWTYSKGPTITGNGEYLYDQTMTYIDHAYKEIIKAGAAVEDARGVLPTNIHTNICMTINMRNWINVIRKRTSQRVQREYRDVAAAMVIEVEKVYPWIYIFVKNDSAKARQDLQDMIWENKNLSTEEKTNMVKKLDIITTEEL